ncbi:hypothetical protein MBLNU457_4483t1 [Dothideomycetes sp. NU457]
MEGPERKKLKSTYQPAPPSVSAPATQSPAPLPAGWTEHTAPTGHKYYYNAETKKSTYTRPTATPAPTTLQNHAPSPAPFAATNHYNSYPAQSSYNGNGVHPGQAAGYGALPAQQTYPNGAQPYGQPQHTQFQAPYQRPRRPQPQDRPKRKAVIPDCAPWILIYTKLGRRFVHNMETRESFWKFPADVMKAVIAFDQLELERKFKKDDKAVEPLQEVRESTTQPPNQGGQSRRRRSESLQREDEEAMAAELAATNEESREWRPPAKSASAGVNDEEGSDVEYEIVEVTESESESEDNEEAEAEAQNDADADAAVEFGEDDIAYQLAHMGEAYGLDPAEYGSSPEPDTLDEEGAAGLPLITADREALFHDLLDDHRINPYTPWPTVLEHATAHPDTSILSDDRYTILDSSKARSAAYDTWSKTRIAALQASRAATAQLDPRIPYLSFLSSHATPKLYWPEFRRKHKAAPEMRATKPPDKEKEKLYREHVARLKLPTATLKKDLLELLKAQPSRVLNKHTDAGDLPKEILTDLRLISLPVEIRDVVVREYISTLPPPPVDGAYEEVDEGKRKARLEREKREAAMRERERRVEEENRAGERERRFAEGRLREGERELIAANRVRREGLRGHFDARDGAQVEKQQDS